MKHKAIFSVLIVVALLCIVVASPAIVDDTTAEDPIIYSDDPEYRMGGFVAGLAIGLTIGLIIGYELGISNPQHSGVNQDELNKKFREMEAEKVTAAMNTAASMISSVLPADTDMWAFTSNYWQRSAEYAVCEYWNSDETYDANTILEITGLPKNVSNYLYSWSEAMDAAYNNLLNQSTLWTDEYSSMKLNISWDSGKLTAGNTPTSETKVFMDFSQIVTPTVSKNTAYIDTDYSNEDLSYTYYDKIYLFGSSSSEIVNVSTGVHYILAPGANTTSSILNKTTNVSGKLPSGTYQFASGASYAGPFSHTAATSAADVQGGLVMGQGNTLYYALSNGDAGVKIYNSSNNFVKNSATLNINVTGGISTKTSVIVGPGLSGQNFNIIRDYNKLVQQINLIVDKTITAAEVEWDIFDNCQASNIYISPSSITASISGRNVSAAESEAIYIQAMSQIADFYNKKITAVDDWNIVTNIESLSLYCYGSIYFNGQLFADNVVFTPYITSTEQKLVAGKANTWTGNGFAMVWGSKDNFTSASLTSYALMDLSAGYELVIDKIVSDGKQIPSTTLTHYTIDKHNTTSTKPDSPVSVPHLKNSSLLMLIILLELSVIVLLIGYITGIHLLYIVSGLIFLISVIMYSIGWF